MTLTFRTEVTAAYSGQTNFITGAFKDGQPVGYVEYSEFQGEIQIDFVKVGDEYQKQGIGSALINEVKRENPGTQINWGMTTPSGEALRRKVGIMNHLSEKCPACQRAKAACLSTDACYKAAGRQAQKEGTLYFDDGTQAYADFDYAGNVTKLTDATTGAVIPLDRYSSEDIMQKGREALERYKKSIASKRQADYQGWPNYETWNANLWPMNEEGTYRYVMDNAPYTADKARRVMEELYPNGTPDMDGPQDYDRVDWQRIADAWNEQ